MVLNPVLLARHTHPEAKQIWTEGGYALDDRISALAARAWVEVPVHGIDVQTRELGSQDRGGALGHARS